MPTLNNLNVVFIRDRDGNFTPVNGFMGSPGRGIVSIERTSGDGTSGSIDVYTITYTDKTTSTFEVYNGSDGESGATPEQIAAAIEQYHAKNPFVKKETDPTVFRWAKAELFDKNALVDPAGRNSFVTIDDIEYYRYNASAQSFEWNNPNPQTGSVAITARGMSQYGGTGSTRLHTFFDDGTEGEQLFIIVNGESRTVTYTTPSDKVLAKITGNYDMENWVLLDMSVMSCMADYPAPKGTVKTVNGISPDGNGNIQFDAADVNAVAQNQGAENAGKFLSINESGEVIPVESGADGITPHIGANGNWYIGDTDTGIKAQGEKGADGTTPHIGENGNWWIGNTDTGVKADASGGSGTDIALGISGAAVGQIARITAVDGAGIPTAWEAVDMASGWEWHLIRSFSVPVATNLANDTSGITWFADEGSNVFGFEINTDENGNAFSYHELYMRVRQGSTANAGDLPATIYVNDIKIGQWNKAQVKLVNRVGEVKISRYANTYTVSCTGLSAFTDARNWVSSPALSNGIGFINSTDGAVEGNINKFKMLFEETNYMRADYLVSLWGR